MTIRKYMLNKTIVINWTNLISHLYYIVLDIMELETILGRYKKKTKVVYIYDNKVGKGQRWQGFNPRRKRVLEDINWQSVIKYQVLIMEKINIHSIIWNPNCHKR